MHPWHDTYVDETVIAKGFPASDGPARLEKDFELPIGDVKPFEIEEIVPHNSLDSFLALSGKVRRGGPHGRCCDNILQAPFRSRSR